MTDLHPNLVPLRALPSASELAQGDDEQLMTLAAAGNKPAFAVLVTRYLPRSTQFCLRFVGEMAGLVEAGSLPVRGEVHRVPVRDGPKPLPQSRA